MKIKIRFQHSDGDVVMKTIEAEPVGFKGFEKFQFAIHKAINEPGYAVTDIATGYQISEQLDGRQLSPNPEGAVYLAEQLLNKYGVYDFEQRQKNLLAKDAHPC